MSAIKQMAMPLDRLPKHVAVVLDGNRRFAQRLMQDKTKGHEWGEKKVSKLIEWCISFSIEELTLYAFSMQNFNRPKHEFDYLMRIFERVCDEAIAKKNEQHENVRIRFFGRLHLLPVSLQKKMRQVEEITAEYSVLKLNICVAYGGREEITDAVHAIAKELAAGTLSPDRIDEQLIKQHLYLDREPDLIIRTGGEIRTSNFLSWQAAYSEWYFTPTLWPEFEKEEFVKALADYAARQRKFGV